MFLIALFAIGFAASDLPDVGNTDNPADLQNAEGIITVKTDIGDWDAAYLTKLGYFCYKEVVDDEMEGTEGLYRSVTYMPENSTEMVSLISTREGNIPTQMVTNSGIVYFSFPNDSILELLYDDGNDVTMLDSIAYSKEDLLKLSSGTDPFKATLSAAVSLLEKNKSHLTQAQVIKKYCDVFKQVSVLVYGKNEQLIKDLIKGATGNYQFADKIKEWYDKYINQSVCNTLCLWTGKATFKVGGSSCTLSGTIWCPSKDYNKYGTYGIVCDADPAKLTVGNAEYEGTGTQPKNKLSYSVDFRGFKPNTTYYYRAFYKFNSSDHGNITPRHGSPTDEVIYDTTIKTFTTGDNILTVDVVMCIDVTGSMSGIINTVKANAISFYDSFKQSCDEEGIQLAALNSQVIAFRDKNEDSNWLETSPTYSLPGQKDDFNNFVNALYADGGGDTAESGLEALEAAFNKTDWGTDDGYHRQVIILWTDAPYLINTDSQVFSDVTLDGLKAKWNIMPSGRRFILFAPNGTDYNGGSWENFDGWTNVIHETNISSGFNDFEYILKSIIGELTSKGKAPWTKAPATVTTIWRPNY